MRIKLFQLLVLIFALSFQGMAQDHHNDKSHAAGHENEGAHGDNHHDEVQEYDPAATAIHHISDANVLTILDAVTIPLPCILYSKEDGLKFMSSGKFDIGHHENGHNVIDRYVLMHGSVYRINDPSFPKGKHHVDEFTHKEIQVEVGGKMKKKDQAYASVGGQSYAIDRRSTLDGGFLGGGITSFYDFSITKNVVAMFAVVLLLMWVFMRTAKHYKNNNLTKAPTGLTNVMETMFLFIRDEVAIPFIGEDKYMKYIPLLMSLFFFVVGLNLFGQIPFFGSINVTGNLTITMVLAIIVFIVVNINGKKDYWQHIFWMPGVPTFVKFILTPVEIMSLFIKPLTLMLRLAGNIAAGHIAILSFIGLIFIFGQSGQSFSGSLIGTAMSIPLTLFMMSIELIVAFVQGFVFAILTASYIGAAIEEHH